MAGHRLTGAVSIVPDVAQKVARNQKVGGVPVLDAVMEGDGLIRKASGDRWA